MCFETRLALAVDSAVNFATRHLNGICDPGRKKIDPSKLHWFPIRESMRRDRFSFDTLIAGEID